MPGMQCIQNMFFTDNFKQKCVILNKKKVEEKWQKEKAAECVTNIVITF